MTGAGPLMLDSIPATSPDGSGLSTRVHVGSRANERPGEMVAGPGVEPGKAWGYEPRLAPACLHVGAV